MRRSWAILRRPLLSPRRRVRRSTSIRWSHWRVGHVMRERRQGKRTHRIPGRVSNRAGKRRSAASMKSGCSSSTATWFRPMSCLSSRRTEKKRTLPANLRMDLSRILQAGWIGRARRRPNRSLQALIHHPSAPDHLGRGQDFMQFHRTWRRFSPFLPLNPLQSRSLRRL